MERLTITMGAKTRDAVQRAARSEGKSVSSTVVELVTEQIEKQRAISPFAALIGAADDPRLPNAIDMEDALKEIWADAANGHR